MAKRRFDVLCLSLRMPVASLSQDARGLPDTDVLSSVPNAAALRAACLRLIPPSREAERSFVVGDLGVGKPA